MKAFGVFEVVEINEHKSAPLEQWNTVLLACEEWARLYDVLCKLLAAHYHGGHAFSLGWVPHATGVRNFCPQEIWRYLRDSQR